MKNRDLRGINKPNGLTRARKNRIILAEITGVAFGG